MRMNPITMAVHTITEAAPNIMVAVPTITSEATLTDIGLNTNRAHSQKGPHWQRCGPFLKFRPRAAQIAVIVCANAPALRSMSHPSTQTLTSL
jgi:hypothetical protein